MEPYSHQQQHEHAASIGQSPMRSVAAATWGKKGVTAKQRQAAARAARLDPLPADQYERGASLAVSVAGGSSASGMIGGSRRGSLQHDAEANFVRRHLAPDGALMQASDDNQLAASTPAQLLQARSVGRVWAHTPAVPTPAAADTFESHDPSFSPPTAAAAASPSQQPALSTTHISRPARFRQRYGESGEPLSPDHDPTAHVTSVLQRISTRAQDTQPPQSPPAAPAAIRPIAAPDSPDEESTAIASPSGVADEQAAQADPASAAVSAQPAAAPDAASLPAPAPSFLTACCPCLDEQSSISCWSSATATLGTLLGLDSAARQAALAEMRQDVILPQDASKLNVTAVERALSSFPPACVLQVSLHRSDELSASEAVAHPLVRLHVLDVRTGAYWRKSDPARHAVAPYENLRRAGAGGEQAAQATLLPLMSQPYRLRSQGAFLPVWDEHLLINESLRHVLDPHAIFFFELLDFGPHVDLNAHPSGFYPIAWAFLKPINARGETNIGTNLRLQLYHYTQLGTRRPDSLLAALAASRQQTSFSREGVPQVYYEWIWQKHTGRVRYPSTLYVDVVGVSAPAREKVRGMRPMLPTQIEEGRLDYSELMATIAPPESMLSPAEAAAAGRTARKQAVEQMTAAQKAALIRRRQAGEQCLIPNNPVHEISAGPTGCLVLRYSPDGRTLAAACGDGLMFTLKLYDSDSGAQLFTYVGHHDLIYDLSWNCLGTAIVTASSDTTAKVWAVDASRTMPPHQQRPTAVATLQHTSFVYTCAFHPKLSDKGVIVTGGFDGAMRIWNDRGDQLHAITEHTAHINSVVIAPNGTRIFSGDASGVIRVWEDTHYTRGAGAGITRGGDETARPLISDAASAPWSSRIRALHTIALDELKGSVITCLRYHPRPERLIVFTRSNALHVVSLLRYDLRASLTGIPSAHHSLRCAISPDGDTLVAGGDDGNAYFFDLNECELYKAIDVGFHSPLFDVSWHPTQHAVAFASFGGDYPIRVWEYNVDRDARSMDERTARQSSRGTLRWNTTLPMASSAHMSMRDSVQLPATSAALPPLATSARAPIATTAAAAVSSSRSSSSRRSQPMRTEDLDSDRYAGDTRRSMNAGDTERMDTHTQLAASKRVTFT